MAAFGPRGEWVSRCSSCKRFWGYRINSDVTPMEAGVPGLTFSTPESPVQCGAVAADGLWTDKVHGVQNILEAGKHVCAPDCTEQRAQDPSGLQEERPKPGCPGKGRVPLAQSRWQPRERHSGRAGCGAGASSGVCRTRVFVGFPPPERRTPG